MLFNTSGNSHNLLILMIFRSVMVRTRRIQHHAGSMVISGCRRRNAVIGMPLSGRRFQTPSCAVNPPSISISPPVTKPAASRPMPLVPVTAATLPVKSNAAPFPSHLGQLHRGQRRHGARHTAQLGKSLQPPDGGIAGVGLFADVVEQQMAVVGSHRNDGVCAALGPAARLLAE
jgi:hypothetical protein